MFGKQENKQEETQAVEPGVAETIQEIDGIVGDFGSDQDTAEETPKEKDKPKLPRVDAAQALSKLVAMVFTFIAVRKGEHWLVTKEESEALGGAIDGVLQKYIPDVEPGEELTLAIATGGILGPRLLAAPEPAEENQEDGSAKKRESESTA